MLTILCHLRKRQNLDLSYQTGKRYASIAIEGLTRGALAQTTRSKSARTGGSVRRAHRLDANHAELVSEFEKHGCSVLSLAGLGNGAPDICVGFGGLQLMCELKNSAQPPSKRKLTPDEERFKMNWTGGYRLVQNVDDVTKTVQLLQGWHRAIRKDSTLAKNE